MATKHVRETFKPRDVDELLDFYLYRRLAAHVVKLFLKTSISPNQVTVIAGGVGALCGFAFYAAMGGQVGYMIIGAACLFGGMVLDCCDGQLARIRGQASMLGRVLDGISDTFPTVSAFLGLTLFGHFELHMGLWGWALAVVAGASTIYHTYLYDATKNVYLSNTKPPVQGGSSGVVTLDQIRAEMDRARLTGKGWEVFALRIMLLHASGQHKAQKNGEVPPDRAITATAQERDIYRTIHLFSMRLWSFLGLATHLTILMVAALCAMVWPAAPLYAFGLIGLPLNGLFAWLLLTDRGRTHSALERICKVREDGILEITRERRLDAA